MFPSFSELFNEFVAKFKQVKEDVDPTVKGSWPFAFGRGVAAIGYSLVILAKELLKQFNPLTATGRFLELWASYDGLARLGASPSAGPINVYGLNTTIIPSDTFWAGQVNGLLYTNTSAATIQTQDINQVPVTIITLTWILGVATAITSFPHSLLTGSFVTISGADQPEYNGNVEVTADSSNVFKFTYNAPDPTTSPATGSPYSAIPIRKLIELDWVDDVVTAKTGFPHGFVDQQYVNISDTNNANFEGFWLITVDLTITNGDKIFTFELVGNPGTATEPGVVRSVHAAVSVQSQDNGPDTVLAAGDLLDIQEPITDVNDTATTAEGLQGGADDESDESLRARMLLSRSTQAGVFTNDQIELAARLINGNTDVYVQNPNTLDVSDPDAILPGQVRVYILRKNDPFGPIPTGGILEITKISIVVNAGLPADVWLDDLFVLPPVLTPVDITMTNVLPDTATMKQAIKSQFEAYFTDVADLGVNIDNDILRATAKETQDLNSGLPETSFISRFDWTDIQLSYAVNNVSNNGGFSRFAFTPGPDLSLLPSLPVVTLTGFPEPGNLVDVLSVVNNGDGKAQFVFISGPILANGREVVISRFTDLGNEGYNGTFVIANVTSTTFDIIAIPFNATETGFFDVTYNGTFPTTSVGTGIFDVAIAFLGDQAGVFSFESETLSRAELPILGTLTVNGQVIS